MKKLKPEDWFKKLDVEERVHKKFRQKGNKIVEKYRGEEGSEYNILWSNASTLESAILSETPKIVATRRFLEKDPVSKLAAEIVERAVTYSNEQDDILNVLKTIVRDRLLPGVGGARIKYVPTFEKDVERVDIPEEEVGEDGYAMVDGKRYKVEIDEVGYYVDTLVDSDVSFADILAEQVSWKQIHWQPGKKRWEEIEWVAIEHNNLSKEDLKDRYGAKADGVEFTQDTDEDGEPDSAQLFEIFDKKNREYKVIARGADEYLDFKKDPWNLENFYPFPRFLFATLTSEKLIPVADYCFYEKQATMLDNLNARIEEITDALRVRMAYEKSIGEELGLMFSVKDCRPVPVEFATKFPNRKIDDFIWFMPLDTLRQVLNDLYVAVDQAKQTIYEITGISDIIRGSTEASETATAQRIKGQYANLRLNRLIDEVQTYVRDLFRIKAEMIVEKIPFPLLLQMANLEITPENEPLLPEVEKLFKDDQLRSFRIEIETDSTLATDENAEQENRIEFLDTIMGTLERGAALIASGKVNPELIQEVISFSLRAFPQARTLEDKIETAFQLPQPAMAPAPAQAPAPGVL